jgi:hypothetical protein
MVRAPACHWKNYIIHLMNYMNRKKIMKWLETTEFRELIEMTMKDFHMDATDEDKITTYYNNVKTRLTIYINKFASDYDLKQKRRERRFLEDKRIHDKIIKKMHKKAVSFTRLHVPPPAALSPPASRGETAAPPRLHIHPVAPPASGIRLKGQIVIEIGVDDDDDNTIIVEDD